MSDAVWLGVIASRGGGLGTVTDNGPTTPPAGWDSARLLTIKVPGITEHADVTIAVRNAAGNAGLVFFHRGGAGGAWWDDGQQETDLLAPLAAAGYRLVQCDADANYWAKAPAGQKLGSAVVAKRPAGLIRHVHDTYSDNLPFICVGHSNGGQAIAYALARYGLHKIIDVAVLCAGPPYSDVYRACNRLPGEEAYWLANSPGGTANFPDESHGYPGDDTGPCFLGDETIEGPLWQSSSLLSSSKFTWPTTRVVQLLSSADTTCAFEQGMLVRDRMAQAGQPYTLGFVPRAPHSFTDLGKARQVIRAAVEDRARLGVWDTHIQASGTQAVVTLREAPKPGDLLVAVRAYRGTLANMPTPSGWTRAIGNQTAATPNRTVAIEYRVADGTEGTSFVFDVVNAARQKIDLCVVKGLTNPVLDQTGSTDVTPGTQLTLTTSATTSADEIAFAVVQTSSTTPALAEAWNGGFTPFGDLDDDTTSAYALLTATGAQSTTETWSVSSNAAGAIATFKGS